MKFESLQDDIAGWPKFKHTDILKEKRRGIKIEIQRKDDTYICAQSEEHSVCDI